MTNLLKQRYNPVETGQETLKDVLFELKDRLVDFISSIKSGVRTFFTTGYETHQSTSRGINSDIISVRMQHHFRNRR